jgi:polyisoprenoid-binding protein YceI
MTLALVAALLVAELASAAEVDPVASRIDFTLTTRWGQPLQGRFPDAHGEVAELGDGRHQVRLQLSTRSVEIVNHSTYTRYTRGSSFFDAAHYPQMEFICDAYPPELLRRGGALPGVLTIRAVHRREVFTISPATCAQPARDCDVVASGSIHLSNYGMDRWNFALSDKVRFSLRLRVRREAGT